MTLYNNCKKKTSIKYSIKIVKEGKLSFFLNAHNVLLGLHLSLSFFHDFVIFLSQFFFYSILHLCNGFANLSNGPCGVVTSLLVLA